MDFLCENCFIAFMHSFVVIYHQIMSHFQKENKSGICKCIRFLVLTKMSRFLTNNVRDPRFQDPNFVEL